MSKPTETYKAFKAQIIELKEKTKAMAEDFFAAEAKLIFDKYPALENFSWNQYTPYFNDGDTCEFSVHRDNPRINSEDWDEYEHKTRYNGAINPNYDGEKATIYREVKDFIQVFDSEDLHDIFGDHCEVIVRRNGTTDVEHYDHE